MSQGHPIIMSSGELAAYAVALGRTIAEVGTPTIADPHQFLGRVSQELDALVAEGIVPLQVCRNANRLHGLVVQNVAYQMSE